MLLWILATTFITTTSAGYGRSAHPSPPPPELARNSNVALWSAQSAVASSVANDYAQQLQTTQQYTNQFTAPVTKQQTGQAFNQVLHQQQASMISAALANAQGAISRGAARAARDNFDQAYAAKEADRGEGQRRDEEQRGAVWAAATTQQNLRDAQQAARHYEDARKTSNTQINANAIQALHGIQATARNSNYGK